MRLDALKRMKLEEEINPVLSISFDVPGYVSIHFFPPKELSKTQKYRLFRIGLRDLAKKLAHHERGGVDFVAAASWIVAKNPQLLQQFGFSDDFAGREQDREALLEEYRTRVMKGKVPREFRHIEPAVVAMRTEDFLKQYLAKNLGE